MPVTVPDAADTPGHPFMASDQSLEAFLRDWERGILPKRYWTHAAHVAVAAFYAYTYDAEDAFRRTKTGITHYNECVGTANTESSGYHETLTRFWSGIVGDFVRGGSYASRSAAVRSAVHKFGEDRKRHRLYYSFDVVQDTRARRAWIPPDRTQILA